MAIPNLANTVTCGWTWTCQTTPASTDYQPQTASANPKVLGLNFSTGTNTAKAANQIASAIYAIAASGNTVINLQSLTNVLGTASVALVRLKGILVRLLSVADDAVNGTACSSVTVGNAATNPNLLFLGGTTPTFTLNNGEHLEWSTPGAAGIAVSPSACNLKVLNNDGANAAAVQVSVIGADA